MEKREGILKVPACIKCNGEKSGYEQYLQTVLPLAGVDEVSRERVATQFQTRLDGNKRLKRELMESLEHTLVPTKYGVRQAMRVKYEPEILLNFSKMLARALHFHFVGTIVSADQDVQSTHMSTTEANSIFAALPDDENHRVNFSFSESVFECRAGWQSDKRVSFWEFKFYGGLDLRSGAKPSESLDTCGALVADAGYFAKLDAMRSALRVKKMADMEGV